MQKKKRRERKSGNNGLKKCLGREENTGEFQTNKKLFIY